MRIIYFAEVNLICITVLLLVLGRVRDMDDQLSTARIAFTRMIWASIAFCASDIFASCFVGRVFPGARMILELGNMVYFESLTVISYLWMRYVYVQLSLMQELPSMRARLLPVPLIVFTLVALTNPFTHFLYTFDAHNIYVRGSGVFFHWVVSWGYLIVPTVRTIRAIAREKSRPRRREIAPLLYFIVAPAICAAIQMLFYSVTSTQAGITISIVMIFMMEQGSRVQTDALTGLNNRRGLDRYIDDYVLRHDGAELSLVMLDLNNFKHVNDQYGHMTGDMALLDAADALRQVCAETPSRQFLCRYGGDEFVLVGALMTQQECDRMRTSIRAAFARKNADTAKPYALEASIGVASGKCAQMEDVERLLRLADEAMYAEKKKAKALRTA